MITIENLWGEEFSVTNDYEKVKQIIGKINKPKSVTEMLPEKILASKTVPFEEKLRITTNLVDRILGHYRRQTICIYSKTDLNDYIKAAIKNGIVAIDTETLGTRDDIPKPATDPFTCRIAGLCLYTPGQKNAYIPINHVDYKTNKRLENQLTEKDIKGALQKLVDAETVNIYHNGKFDYMVLYYTCGIKVPISWDTMIGSQLLNENDRAGLKYQYVSKIDPEQEKYDLDKLFNLDCTALYPPELFALYSATDPYMTYKLYEYQVKEYSKSGNEKLSNLFKNIEMPIVTVTAEMEMRGITVDLEFAKRLSSKFHKKLDYLDSVIENEMNGNINELIAKWRETPEANYKPVIKGKEQKSLSEKLNNPVDLTSPTQLGILLYDILKVLKIKKDGKKTTDEAALLSIKDTLPLAGMILKRREYEKFLGTYIDVLPTYCNPYDGRVHAHFNQLGREDHNVVTGRMSSSEPSLQVIPSRGNIVTVRCMFTGTTEYEDFTSDNDFEIPIENEVLMSDGSYKWVSDLKPNDSLSEGVVSSIKILNDKVCIKLK